jgi:hypothetical protein
MSTRVYIRVPSLPQALARCEPRDEPEGNVNQARIHGAVHPCAWPGGRLYVDFYGHPARSGVASGSGLQFEAACALGRHG